MNMNEYGAFFVKLCDFMCGTHCVRNIVEINGMRGMNMNMMTMTLCCDNVSSRLLDTSDAG